jgi:hypothetical protein
LAFKNSRNTVHDQVQHFLMLVCGFQSRQYLKDTLKAFFCIDVIHGQHLLRSLSLCDHLTRKEKASEIHRWTNSEARVCELLIGILPPVSRRMRLGSADRESISIC